MNKKGVRWMGLMIVLIIGSLLTSGCFHTGSSRDVFFPREDNTINYLRGTIATARHNFTGAFTDTRVALGSEERQRSIDNFYIGEGGADLYIWAQVYFSADTSGVVDFERYVHVMLIYEPGSDEERIIAQNLYVAPNSGRYEKAELMTTLNGTKPGLYSLRAEATGTAFQEGGVTYYDWYLFSVNGIYSERSYNHNAPNE